MPGRLQATAVCAIAWQQALPEARVETDSAYSSVLKSASLWRFDNRTQRMRDERQALHHKSWPPTQKKKGEQGFEQKVIVSKGKEQRSTMACTYKLIDMQGKR